MKPPSNDVEIEASGVAIAGGKTESEGDGERYVFIYMYYYVAYLLYESLGLMKYSVDEIKQATEKFISANHLGSGAFGEVYSGCLRHTKVAIKTVKIVRNN